MEENLVSLFTKLSTELLLETANDERDSQSKKINQNVKNLRQVAFDIIHSFDPVKVKDPCQTSDGMKWKPELIATDYCYELARRGASKNSDCLWTNVNEIVDSEIDRYEDLLKFLLCLKGPVTTDSTSCLHSFSLSGDHYFFKFNDPFQLIPASLTQNKLQPIDNSYKKFEENVLLSRFVDVQDNNNSPPIDKSTHISRAGTEVESCTGVYENENNGAVSQWSVLLDEIEQGIDSDIAKDDKKTFNEKYAKCMSDNDYRMHFKPKRKLNRVKSECKESNLALSVFLQEQKMMDLLDTTRTQVSLRVIPLEEFIRDALFALCGISSMTFLFDEELNKLNLAPGLCLASVPPDTLIKFSEDFIEAGVFYIKLREACSMALNRDIETYGIVYQTFWKAVSKYLDKYSEDIAKISVSDSLLKLKECVRPIHSTLATLWKICGSQSRLSLGGNLLSFVFEAALSIPQELTQQVIMSIFYDCCVVYLSKIVQLWIFQGQLDNLLNVDNFVYINPEMIAHRDRSYYLSIKIEKMNVPYFLRDFADRILACGEAVHLLKLFNPENKLSHYLEAKKYPKIQLCMNEAQLFKLRTLFHIYERTVFQLSEEIEVKEKVEKLVEKIPDSTASEDRRYKEKLKKELEMKSLQKQIQEAKETKERIKEEMKKEEQRIQDEAKKIEERRLEIVEMEKSMISSKYEEMRAFAENKKARAEWRSKRIQNFHKRASLISENILDAEGNIINIDHSIEENANTLVEKVTDDGQDIFKNIRNEAENNKMKMMTGEYMSQSPDDNCNLTVPITDADSLIARCMGTDNENILNSNPETVITDAMRNKMKILGTEINNENAIMPKSKYETTEAIKNKRKMLESDYFNKDYQENVKNKLSGDGIMTEAMRNKMKILGVEYEGKTCEKEDKNMDHVIITDAEKNKLKILSSEFDKSFDQHSSATNQPPLVMTDALKNKMKVLGTEFGNDAAELAIPVLDKPLTEAMKNKLKVLSSEYNLSAPVEAKVESAKDLSEAEKNKLKILEPSQEHIINKRKEVVVQTDALKNKAKIMSSDIFSEDDEENRHQRFRKDGVISEAEKNKQKMLSTVLELSANEEESNSKIIRKTASFLPSSMPESSSDNEEMIFPVLSENSGNTSEFALVSYDFTTPALFTSLPHVLRESSDCVDWDKVSPEMFTKYLERSLDVALSCQERLVNVALFKHYLIDEKYLTHIHSLRNYFLLYDGEFSRCLTHGLFQSLVVSSKPKQFFVRSAFSNIVNEALNSTTCGSTNISLYFQALDINLELNLISNANNLSFQILEMPNILDIMSHCVFTPFQLSYSVSWPLNIILTDTAISQYRKIFHLFVSLKRVHWTLNETFSVLKSYSKDKTIDGKRLINSPHYTKLGVYRHAMTLFIMTLEEHMCANGVYDAWENFLKDMESAKNLDDLYLVHVRYLKDILRRCFLVKSSNDLLACIHDLIELGLKFHYTLITSEWVLINNLHYEHPMYDSLKYLFQKFCQTTAIFYKTLRKRIHHSEMKMHLQLVELIEMKIKV